MNIRLAVCDFLLLVAVVLACVPTASAQKWTGNVNFILGAKALDEDDWWPVEEQGEFGVEFDMRRKGWPLSIAVDLMGSSDEADLLSTSLGTVKFEGSTSELNLGVRKIWDSSGYARPFLGGGVSFVRAELERRSLSARSEDSDSGVGFWLGGGVYWTVGEHLNVGFEAKASYAEVTLFGADVEAGGGHFGILVGYHW